jgi:hypothetical protein
MDFTEFLNGIKTDLIGIFGKLTGHPVAEDVANVVQKIEGVTEGDVKADLPELKGDAEKAADDVKTDAQGLVHDVAGAVEGETAPAAPEAAEAAPEGADETAPTV